MKKLKKGDKVIEFGKFHIYHPECYRKDRESVLENIGKLDQQSLIDANRNIDDFRKVVNSPAVSDSWAFYQSWGKMLFTIDLLVYIIAEGERSGTIGFLQKFRLKKHLSECRNEIIQIGTSYREDYGTIRIALDMKKRFPSSGEPTMRQLQEEENNALNTLRKEIDGICNSMEIVRKKLIPISKKTAQKERAEIEEQIRKIPKQITIL